MNKKRLISVLMTLLLMFTMSGTTLLAEEIYTVKSGDVLWKIAKANDTTWEALAKINNLSNPNLIFPGDQLQLTEAEEAKPVEEVTVEAPISKADAIMVTSRDVQIPAVFTYPTEGSNFPLVVMAHGHGGTKDVAGGFVQASETLAAAGIASIRMDFAGCGESSESFSNNTLTKMLADMEACLNYALDTGKINQEKVSVFGYSMGGRLAMLSAARNPIYKSIATWAPAATNGPSSMYVFMGGQEAFETYNTAAQTDGTYLFTTMWGQEQLLSKEFFDDMTNTKPEEEVAPFTGPVLIVNGDKDDIIDATVIESAVNAFANSSSVTKHTIEGADHGLGLYSGETELTNEALKVTTDFLILNSK